MYHYPPPIEDILHEIHEYSGANQTALYCFSYPRLDQLLLVHSIGEPSGPSRYWRPQCSEPEAIHQIRAAFEPILQPAESLIGLREHTLAISVRNGEYVIGAVVFCFFVAQPPARVTAMQEKLNQLSAVLFSCWIDFIVAEQTRPLSILFKIAGTISSSLDLERVLLNVVEQATILFRAKMSSLHLVDWKKHELEMITAYGCSLDYLDKPNQPIDGTFLGKVVMHNQVMQIVDIFEEPLYAHKDLARREGVHSLMAAPISFHDQILGVLNIYSSHPRRWQRSEMELLKTFADHAAVAISNVRFHEQMLTMEEQLHVTAKRSILGELAAGLAHEIRNPLAVINMLIHSWKTAPPMPTDFVHDVNVVAQKISDLNNLVTDLLNLSVSRPLDRTPQNLEDLIDRVHRLLRHRINQQKINYKKKISLQDPVLSIDRERMEQAVLNLLLNALDATPEGETIAVELREEDSRVAVDISDSGPGIPADKFPDLFKMFRSTKKHGSGLGLPITKRIVEEHHGELLVTQNDAQGVTFTIYLPKNVEL